jgi:2-polyprenyl-6-methoxyphenol hydroxylase-like FAD-dependent oxidoreductase
MTASREATPELPYEAPSSAAEVVVVGGSIAGAATARALALIGREVLLVEKNARPDNRRLAGEMMHPRGAQVLARLGFLDRVRALGGTPIRGFACWEGPGWEPLLLDYAKRPTAATDRGISLHHHELVESLLGIARTTPGVTAIRGELQQVRWQGDRVTGVQLRQGDRDSTVATRLVVAADGRHSRTRARLGIAHTMAQPSMSIGAAVPAAALPYADRGHVFLGAWGPCLAYPIGRGDARVVLDYPIGKHPGRDLAGTLERTHLGVYPAPLRDAIAQSLRARPPRFAANHHLAVNRVWVPGAALVGDANGIVHPLTAAGMTLSLHDAEALGAALAAPGPITRHHLADYARRRQLFAWARTALCDSLYEVFQGHTAEAATMRRAVFEHWRSSAAARQRTLSLLSCDSSSPVIFVEQYLRVLGRAVLDMPPAAETMPAWRLGSGLLADGGRLLGRQAREVIRVAAGVYTGTHGARYIA